MSYKIAYGVDSSALRNRQLIDKFIVATLNKNEKQIKEILISMLPQQEIQPIPLIASKPVSAKPKTEPFAHLKEK